MTAPADPGQLPSDANRGGNLRLRETASEQHPLPGLMRRNAELAEHYRLPADGAIVAENERQGCDACVERWLRSPATTTRSSARPSAQRDSR